MIKNNLKLIKNFSSLAALQISNYLFPLITFPYLVRVLGVENYGTANFVIAFISYFVTFTNYGFKLSATQQVSIFRNNLSQVENIFNSTVIIKSLLCIIAFLILSIILFFFKKFGMNFELYTFAFMIVLGNVFYPDWFFQGIEKMSYLSYVIIPLRIFSTVLIFIFVTVGEDLIHYIVIISLYQFISGFALYFLAKKKFGIKFKLSSKYQLLRQLKKGYHIFLSQISINIYTSSNTFILGLLSGNMAVGYFTGANKIREALQGVFANMGITVFPHFSDLLIKNREKGLISLKKYLKITSIVSFLSGIMLYIYSEEIVYFILGEDYLNSIRVLRILSFLPFIIVLSNVLGIQLMLNTGYSKEFNRIISIAALINLALMFVLVPLFKEQGAAFSMLFVEVIVTAAMGAFVFKRKLLQ